MIDRLVDWVNQNSGSRNSEGLRAMQDLIREAFSTLPGKIDLIPLPDGQLIHARMGVGDYRFEVRGWAAHAGRDFEAGRNAINALSEIVLKTSKLNQFMEGVIVNVGRIEGGGPTNVVPDRAVADLNVRAWRADQMVNLEERLRSCGNDVGTREGYEVEFTVGISRAPKEVSPDSEALLARFVNTEGRSVLSSGGVTPGAEATGISWPRKDCPISIPLGSAANSFIANRSTSWWKAWSNGLL